jgi:hypothetical protein
VTPTKTDQTDSQIAAKNNVTSQPSEVKENYVDKPVAVGITAFREDPKVEIDSPMRKKKGALMKLKVNEEDAEDAYLEKLEAEQRRIMPFFDQVVSNFEENQKLYKDLQALTVDQLQAKYTPSNLNELVQAWQKSMELRIPEEQGIDANSITDFNNKKSSTFKEIEKFIYDVNEWVHEKTEEINQLPNKRKPSRKEISSVQMINAEAEIQAQIQARAQAEEQMRQQQQIKNIQMKKREQEENEKLASQLDSLQEDADLLKGLEEIEKKEKEDLAEIAKNFTPRDQRQSTKKEEEQEDGSSVVKYAVIAAAILAVGVSLFWNSQRKR